MGTGVILVITGYILFLFILIKGSYTKKKIILQAGKNVSLFSKNDKTRTVIIYIVSLILIALAALRGFSFLIKIILEMCGVLGIYITTKENNFNSIAGIYENGLVCSDGYFPFDDIVTLPVLNLPLEEQAHYAKESLILATKSKGNVEIIFENETECNRIKESLLTVCPKLNQ